jgi:hypothetical protein
MHCQSKLLVLSLKGVPRRRRQNGSGEFSWPLASDRSRQLQGGLYSNQSQLFILDRMVEIYPKCMVLQQI